MDENKFFFFSPITIIYFKIQSYRLQCSTSASHWALSRRQSSSSVHAAMFQAERAHYEPRAARYLLSQQCPVLILRATYNTTTAWRDDHKSSVERKYVGLLVVGFTTITELPHCASF